MEWVIYVVYFGLWQGLLCIFCVLGSSCSFEVLVERNSYEKYVSGKRPRDLLNPKAVKYLQAVFSIKDAISKKESREIGALFGVTVTQVYLTLTYHLVLSFLL